MSIHFSINDLKTIATIKINGRFDFSVHKTFRNAYKNLESVKSVIVDLSQVDYMDSAALGMLLLLREHAHARSATVTLSCAKPSVTRVLEIANFGRLFEID